MAFRRRLPAESVLVNSRPWCQPVRPRGQSASQPATAVTPTQAIFFFLPAFRASAKPTPRLDPGFPLAVKILSELLPSVLMGHQRFLMLPTTRRLARRFRRMLAPVPLL